MKKKNTSRNLAAITVVAFSAIFLSSCGDNKTSAGLEKGLACTGNSEVLTEGSDHAVEQAEQQVTEECVTPEEAPTIANKQPLAAATTDSNIGTLRFLQYAPVSKSCDGPNCLIFVTETLRQPMINPDENILIAYQDHPDPGSATEGTLKLQCNQTFARKHAAITGEFRVKLCHSTKARDRRMCMIVFARTALMPRKAARRYAVILAMPLVEISLRKINIVSEVDRMLVAPHPRSGVFCNTEETEKMATFQS